MPPPISFSLLTSSVSQLRPVDERPNTPTLCIGISAPMQPMCVQCQPPDVPEMFDMFLAMKAAAWKSDHDFWLARLIHRFFNAQLPELPIPSKRFHLSAALGNLLRSSTQVATFT